MSPSSDLQVEPASTDSSRISFLPFAPYAVSFVSSPVELVPSSHNHIFKKYLPVFQSILQKEEGSSKLAIRSDHAAIARRSTINELALEPPTMHSRCQGRQASIRLCNAKSAKQGTRGIFICTVSDVKRDVESWFGCCCGHL